MQSAASGGAFSGKTLLRRQWHLTPTNSPSNVPLNLWVVLSVHMCCTTATTIMHTSRGLLLSAHTFTAPSIDSAVCQHLQHMLHLSSASILLAWGMASHCNLAHGRIICILKVDILPSKSCKLPCSAMHFHIFPSMPAGNLRP